MNNDISAGRLLRIWKSIKECYPHNPIHRAFLFDLVTKRLQQVPEAVDGSWWGAL